ncbi:Phospholipase C/P1 nuclease domain containing protein [Tylopilus felleus]
MYLFSFLVSALLIPHAYAWGAVGHEVVATIAQMHLHPSVMPKLCDILDYDGECHLAPVAAWADRIRRIPKYWWTGPLHYINAVDDYPSGVCAFPGSNGWGGRTHINVLHGIRNTTNVLQDFEASRRAGWNTDDDDIPSWVQDALKFLIHFLGDMHEPLHLTGRNRGGNGDKVAFDGRTTNLHRVWDSFLISERLRTLPANYSYPLPLPDVESYLRDTIYDPYIRRIVWEGLLGKWEDELDDWLVCPPSPCALARRRGQAQRPSSSAWQTVLSLFSKTSRDDDECEDDESGLGVDDDHLCPYAWAKPIQELNCEIVVPPELDFVPYAASHDGEECACGDASEGDAYDAFMVLRRGSHYFELYTPEYAGVIKDRWIVEKLLTQGGIRLAAVLNWIFAEVEEDELKRTYLTL